ncbi:MAG: hypothetical protein WBC96_01000 [Thermodesulfobacteriota bacterium]
MLPQRRFTDENERKSVSKTLHDKHIDTSEWEDRGKQYAELFIAAKPDHFPELLEKMNETHSMPVHEEFERTAVRNSSNLGFFPITTKKNKKIQL